MKIVTDSAADLTAAEMQSFGVVVAPLYIQFPEGEVSSNELAPDNFYARLGDMHPAIPTTAQPSQGVFAEIYRELSRVDPDILSVHISSGLSGSTNAARLGAELVPEARVTVWDTLTLAGGQRFQVLAAAAMAREGWELPAIEARLAEIRERTEVVFTLETVEYLARGGRIGRVQALAGMLLNVKPVIHVDHGDGKYNTLAKTRSDAKALATIADFLAHTYRDELLWVAVQHGQAPGRADALAGMLNERLNIARIEPLRVSPVLGVHTGPGIVGASVVPMHLMGDLL